MKETAISGIIRRFDDLGRIVVPREIRRLLQLHEGDAMEISVAENSIHLNKYQPLRFREAVCGPCLTAFCRSFRLACAICDTEHVLASRVATIPRGPMLSQPARDHIQALEPYLYSPDCPLPLLEDGSHPVDTLWTPHGGRGAAALPHRHRHGAHVRQTDRRHLDRDHHTGGERHMSRLHELTHLQKNLRRRTWKPYSIS